jgi:lipid-A-disaccharide synthase
MKNKLIMLVAGEPSGDLHGANLIRNLKKLDNSLEFIGAGGKRMRQAGLKEVINMEKLSIVGFKEVFGKISILRHAFNELSDVLKKEKPDCFIPIDYPGFNFRMAKAANEAGIPTFYYISPQIWAWGKNRIEKVKKYANKIFVLLPFEKEFYSGHGVKAEFVGHPLIDIVKPSLKREDAFLHFGFNRGKTLIGILPGSRWEEVRLSLPVMAGACEKITEEIPHIQFGILVSENISEKKLKSLLNDGSGKFKLIRDKGYDFINICDLVLVNSGTATLETAILEKPMLIIYKLSFFSWLLGKMLIRIPYFGLVNIVEGKKIVPEFLQFGATPSRIAKESLNILLSQRRIKTMRQNLSEVKNKLGEEGSSQRIAEAILKELKK